MAISSVFGRTLKQKDLGRRIVKDFKRYRYVYMMLLPVIIFYVLFCYLPMYGSFMGFEDYNLSKGIFGSPIASNYGFGNFIQFFTGLYFKRVLFNTLYLNFLSLVFCFPAPIILALLINELRNKAFKRVVQSVSYLPFFISMVVVAGIIHDFTGQDGIITYFARRYFGLQDNVNMLAKSAFYRSIYISSDVWQGIGFNSIIFISAIAGINPEIYEASIIDGAGRWKQMLHVTLPGISHTIIILLILQVGSLMSTNLEKVLLLYSPSTYGVSDVISSYIYRQGIVQSQFGLSAAAGLFNSVVNFSILVITNKICRRATGTSLF